MMICSPEMLAENIKRARLRIYLTQEEVADRLAWDVSDIKRMERGKLKPVIWDLPVIARALETTIDSLFEGVREVI